MFDSTLVFNATSGTFIQPSGGPAAIQAAYTTVDCQANIIAGGLTSAQVGTKLGAYANACNSISSMTALANLDPPFGSVFPSSNTFPSSAAGLPADAPGTWVTGVGASSSYYNPGSLTGAGSMVGLPIVSQVGWGGGPAGVTLSPPTTNTVWGVHATPATTVSTAAGTSAVLISWEMGTYAVGAPGSAIPTVAAAGAACTGTCIGNLVNTASPGSFVPTGTTVTPTIKLNSVAVVPSSTTCIQHLRVYQNWGTSPDVNNNVGPAGSAAPNCMAAPVQAGGAVLASTTTATNSVGAGYFNQATVYPGANGTCAVNASSATCAACAAAANANAGYWYRSPLICHAYVTGLTYGKAYTYTISASVAVAGGVTTTYGMPAFTTSPTASSFAFIAPAAPSTASAPSTNYPINWVLMADVGQTFNSSLTAQYVSTYNTMVGGLHGALPLRWPGLVRCG